MIKILATTPVTVDSDGFKARLQGFAVRDCLLVLELDNNVSLGLLVRQESNSSILDEAVRTGEGVLDIDAARVTINLDAEPDVGNVYYERRGLPYPDRKERGIIFRPGAVTGEKMSSEGRFPSNLILKHTPSCVLEGTKRVKPSNGSGTAHQDNKEHANKVYQGGWNPKGVSGTAGFASGDGTEEVANWVCQPGCPVKEMDNQSGTLGNGFRPNHKTSIVGDRRYVTYEVSADVGRSTAGFNDSGGASRFFKQVQTDTELEDYLDALIRKP